MRSSTPNLRILIIEDNPDIRKDFIKILATDPYFEIDGVSQGQEGIQYIKKAQAEGKPYALVFVEIRMPSERDGIETIKHIWKLDRDIQVVIYAAYSDDSWEEAIATLGVRDSFLVLKKPFDSIFVRQLAHALTRKWQLIQESRQRKESLEKYVQERTDSLQRCLSLTRATLESSTDRILVVDNSGKIIDFNTNFVSLWKIPPALLKLKDDKIIFQHISKQLQKPQEFLDSVKRIKSQPEAKKLEICKFADGRIYECYSQPHKINKKIVGRVWSFHDVTKRVYLEEKLEYQATHDMLTDLPNRVLLNDRLNQAILSAKRAHALVGVLFLDLDRFKQINDSLSHGVGDTLLKYFAKRIKQHIREEDTLARIGGDEFVMVLPNLHKEEEAVNIANKILTLMQEPFFIARERINITASIGVCLYPKDGKNVEELLKNADLAMYRSKEFSFS